MGLMLKDIGAPWRKNWITSHSGNCGRKCVSQLMIHRGTKKIFWAVNVHLSANALRMGAFGSWKYGFASVDTRKLKGLTFLKLAPWFFLDSHQADAYFVPWFRILFKAGGLHCGIFTCIPWQGWTCLRLINTWILPRRMSAEVKVIGIWI